MSSPYAGTTPVPSLAGGGGVVTLLEGRSFCISGRTGDIVPDLPHGLFVLDARVLSAWELRVDRHTVEPLAVEIDEPFSATFVGRTRPRPGQADADVVVFRRRSVGYGMREEIELTNHGLVPVTLVIDLACGVDFAGLFDVKLGRRGRAGATSVERTADHFRHAGADRLGTSVEVAFSTPATTVDDHVATWLATVEPGGSWRLDVDVSVAMEGQVLRAEDHHGEPGAVPRRRSSAWRASLPTLDTDEARLQRTVARSTADLGALLLSDPDHPEDVVPAAGAPWFMTLFGRDSLLTSWMALPFDRGLARGTLRSLARLQGLEHDDRTEEQPGRILHEIRVGTSGSRALRRGDLYYGSVDATPLFVVLLGELARWDEDDSTARALLPHADRALAWIDRWADVDGDGYAESQRISPDGLVNQGWKDSWDAIRHPDGRLAEGPIALCEVQGYVYAAHRARAELAERFGDSTTASTHRELAADLQRRFDSDFWLEDEGTYAVGLDGTKRTIASVASNVGHCLWTGIVPRNRAASVASRLMAEDMWSGWGIRTLSTTMPAYNPVSYHNGSVWPHDNAIAAAGLARYGFHDDAHRVIDAQLSVAEAHGGRLPELLNGFPRHRLHQATAYPTSCSPQAWAAAAPLMWLRILLGIDPGAAGGAPTDPTPLPTWLGHLRLDGVPVDGQHVGLGRGSSSPA